MRKYNYFLIPTKVKFWNYINGRYHGGIAYRNEIICGCCGDIFNISEVYKLAPDTLIEDPIIAYNDWIGISSAISEEK